jgi:K+-transporting ATPase KdpF subunit
MDAFYWAFGFVALGLFVYLVFAMLKPEWLS